MTGFEMFRDELLTLRKQQDSGAYRICPRCGKKDFNPQNAPFSLSAWPVHICHECSRHEHGIAEMNVFPDIDGWYWFRPQGDYKDYTYAEAENELESAIVPYLYELLKKYSTEEKRELWLEAAHNIKGIRNIHLSNLRDGKKTLQAVFDVSDNGILYVDVKDGEYPGAYDYKFTHCLSKEELDKLETE